MANRMTTRLAGIPGLETPWTPSSYRHSYWRYPLFIDAPRLGMGPDELAKTLFGQGIGAGPHYIRKPAFETEIFQKQRTFGQSRFPFTLAAPEALRWDPERFPGTYEFLERVLVLPWNESLEDPHIDFIAGCLCEAASVSVGSRS